MSGLFGSTTIKGTRLTDFSGTSAEVGKAIPFGYGTFPVDGFIGWAPLPPVEHRKVRRQGKGGVKQETYTYTLSYAVFFCKGPIYGVKWIKRNGKVVYTTDPNAPIEDHQYAAKWAQRVNFHWGTRDQLPDSLIESYEGVGNVSGFPDMFYITVEDEDVTDNGGAPPNYEACVIADGMSFGTSPPYPIYDEGLLTGAVVSYSESMLAWWPEDLLSSAQYIGMELKDTLRLHTNEPQPMSSMGSYVGMELRQTLRLYTNEPQPMASSAAYGGASLVHQMVLYTNEVQPMQSSVTYVGGVLL